MTAYLTSFAVGILVGVIYALLGVRSPAPPYIALLGLLGMLIGESLLPIAKNKIFPVKEPQQIEQPPTDKLEK